MLGVLYGTPMLKKGEIMCNSVQDSYKLLDLLLDNRKLSIERGWLEIKTYEDGSGFEYIKTALGSKQQWIIVEAQRLYPLLIKNIPVSLELGYLKEFKTQKETLYRVTGKAVEKLGELVYPEGTTFFNDEHFNLAHSRGLLF